MKSVKFVAAIMVATALMATFSQALAGQKISVAVSVVSDSLEREVLGYARNELRRLSDVEVVDTEEDHFFHLKISHLGSTNRLGVRTGHMASRG